MSMTGMSVAVLGTGSAEQRAAAVECAERGADVALGTLTSVQGEEFGVNSIANEIWTIGREHFVRVMDAADPAASAGFAAEAWDKLGRCDALIFVPTVPGPVPMEELSGDEWDPALRASVTAAFLALQSFGRLFARQGQGRMGVALPAAGGDVLSQTVRGALQGMCAEVEGEWAKRGVHVAALEVGPGFGALAALFAAG